MYGITVVIMFLATATLLFAEEQEDAQSQLPIGCRLSELSKYTGKKVTVIGRFNSLDANDTNSVRLSLKFDDEGLTVPVHLPARAYSEWLTFSTKDSLLGGDFIVIGRAGVEDNRPTLDISDVAALSKLGAQLYLENSASLLEGYYQCTVKSVKSEAGTGPVEVVCEPKGPITDIPFSLIFDRHVYLQWLRTHPEGIAGDDIQVFGTPRYNGGLPSMRVVSLAQIRELYEAKTLIDSADHPGRIQAVSCKVTALKYLQSGAVVITVTDGLSSLTMLVTVPLVAKQIWEKVHHDEITANREYVFRGRVQKHGTTLTMNVETALDIKEP